MDRTIYNGDCFEIMERLAAENPNGLVDCIITDPPYFLSNGGLSCQAGKAVIVDKGDWDKSMGVLENHAFNRRWLALCQKLLKPNGTIWVSGTHHVIHSIGFAMQELEMKILNEISWEKPNPPPNLSCRYFTHSTETIIWAAKNENSKHCFNYDLMRSINGGKQMKTVWQFLPPSNDEKFYGKHPTQKPVKLMERFIQASTMPGNVILDPFMGSGTTGVAALMHDRQFIGIEQDAEHFKLAEKRLEDVPNLLEVA
ncbi:MAG: site-specific DNA-methyltransferase [Rickettsiales bacterium]|jgi:site-specific DNA-methyltransferase (adenine-specific)|nr:site-specific DNA-methyltransferase [Rickettsiales bacterium]